MTMACECVATLPSEQLRQIDELCEAMDREDIGCCAPILAEVREHWIQCAREGKPLPKRWCGDKIEAEMQERLAQHGTREWRKAFPGLI
mgnify:CR=1 FL=1